MAAAVMTLGVQRARGSPSYTIAEVGLTGPNYTYAGSGGFYQSSSGGQLSSGGDASGVSNRFSSTGGNLGQDTWFYNGSATQQIGLTGGGYSSSVVGGTFERSSPTGMNLAGDVIGLSNYVSGTTTTGAYDAWIFNGASTQKIGLSGSQYAGAGDFPLQINSSGDVIGYDLVNPNAPGAVTYQDAWLYNGSSSQKLGLSGPVYSVVSSGKTFEVGIPQALNDAGEVAGASERFSSTGGVLGYDAWIYNGSSTQQIGLIGGVYTNTLGASGNVETSQPVALSANGDVLGYAYRYSPSSGATTGQDSWIYNGSATVEIGLTGANYSYVASGATHEQSTPLTVNPSGQAIGFSLRYDSSGNSLGQDAWVYNGSTSQALGLSGAGYGLSGSGGTTESSKPVAINAAGDVTGVSTRYDPTGVNPGTFGTDSWYFNGSSIQQIGVTEAQDPFASKIFNGVELRTSAPTQVNAVGDVIGASQRYVTGLTSGGQDGWLFDPALDQTFLLQFSIDSGNQYSFTNPEILTDTGGVLGEYELFNGSIDQGEEAFYWSESNGLSNLGALVNGGLSAAGWQNLANVYDTYGASPNGAPLYITGEGLLTGQGGGQSDFLMTEIVPEPGMGALLVIAGAGMAARRRRRGQVL